MPIDLSGKTVEDTLTALRQAVEAKGADFIYSTPDGRSAADDDSLLCQYRHGDEPGCLVGHVLHAWGVTLDALEASEGSGALMLTRGWGAPGMVQSILAEAQRAQDIGKTWGEALAMAEAYVNRYAVPA